MVLRRLTIAAGLVALLGGSVVQAAPAPSLEDTLIALEKQSWAAWQDHDTGFFERFLSDDHVEMQDRGPAGKAPVLTGVRAGCVVKSYAVDRFKLTRFSPETALLTYRAEQDTDCGGFKVPSPVWATSLFVKRAGRWQNALYVHTPAGR
jgi:hypothetical protein